MGLIVVPILFIYLIIAIVVTYKVGRIPKTWPKKLLVRLISIFLFVGLIAGDAIAGRIYVMHLCNKDGGIVVNDTAIISEEYFDEKGNLIMEVNDYFGKGMKIQDRYLVRTWKDKISGKVSKRIIEVVDLISHKTIAKLQYYDGGAGWFESISPGGGMMCPDFDLESFQQEFFSKVFMTASDNKEEAL
jgi:hypothetical protein